MNASLSFWIVFLVLVGIMWYCDHAFGMLRDAGTAVPKPFSFARVQLAWWTVIIFSAMITILLLTGHLPTLDNSTLVLLGISAGTTTTARLIDQSDQKNLSTVLSQDISGQNFLLDILSDKTGINIHRLQTVILNLTFGVWFIYTMLHNLTHDPCTASLVKDCASHPFDFIIPPVSNNDLILLGLSSGTYAALKSTENKEDVKDSSATVNQQEFVPDEGAQRNIGAQG